MRNNANDFSGDVVLNGGTLNHSNQAGDPYGAAGNKLRLNDAVLNSAEGNYTASIVREIVVTGDVILRGHNSTGSGLNPLVVNGPITGTGNVLFSNQTTFNVGQLTLGGAASNTYSGATRAYANLMLLNKSGGAIAIPGDLEIGGGPAGTDVVRLLAANQIADAATVTVNATGKLDLNNFSDSIERLALVTGALLETGTGAGGVLSVGSLALDGVAQAAGTTYTATDLPGFIAGNGSVVVSVGPGTVILIR